MLPMRCSHAFPKSRMSSCSCITLRFPRIALSEQNNDADITDTENISSVSTHSREHGRKNGAIGGKLIGAGGGGFLMFYAEEKTKLRHAMRQVGLREVRIKFDFEGTSLVARS